MKKHIYIGLFILLGFLLQFYVHGTFEIAYSVLLWRSFDVWSFGMTYDQLWMIHHVLSLVLLFLGLFFGYRSGNFWWSYLYQEDGMLKPEFRKKWRC